ncbi:MAG: hypothetical protein JW871_08560 [Endomicrobiales bacterium]|nr:hypothetical protein [Endomicrobiales bacterium]
MRRLLVLSIAVCFAMTAFAAENTSVRLKGMGGALNGIVEDEYTDLLANPANIVDIEGKRLYTNLSNLSNGTGSAEAAFSNVSINQFLIGGITKINPVGNVVGIMETWGSITPQTLRSYGDWATALNNIDPTSINQGWTQTLVGSTGQDELANQNVGTTYRYETGKAENVTNNTMLIGGMGYELDDKIDLGLGITSTKITNETTRTNFFNDNPDTADANNDYRESYSNTITNNMSTLTLIPAVKHQTLENLSVEVTLPISLYNDQNNDETLAIAAYGTTYTGGLGPNPVALNTQVDTADQRIEPKGTGFALNATAYYDYTSNTTLVASFGYMTAPKKDSTVDYSVTRNNAATISSFAGTLDYEEKNTTNSLLLGSQTNINEDLLMGIGIVQTVNDAETTLDGEAIMVANEIFAGSQVRNTVTAVKTTTLNIPVGFEYKIKDVAKARMGSTYTITKTKTDTTVETITKDITGTPTVYRKTVDLADTKAVTTTFFYGAGFNIVKNATIDVLGCSNLTNLVGWNVGINIFVD